MDYDKNKWDFSFEETVALFDSLTYYHPGSDEPQTFTGLLNLVQKPDDLANTPIQVTDNQPLERGATHA